MWVTGQRRTNEHTQMSRQRDRQTNKQTDKQTETELPCKLSTWKKGNEDEQIMLSVAHQPMAPMTLLVHVYYIHVHVFMSSVTLIQKRHVPGRTQEKLYSLSVITAQYMQDTHW